MNITKIDIDALNAQLSMVIEPADYEEAVEKEIRSIRQKGNFPGFRKGMVPKSLVKKMYGLAILSDTINKLISDKLYDYIKENDLNVLGDPLPNREAAPEPDLANETTFTFVFDIALAPAMDIKLNGHNKVPYYNVEVTDEMVENQVKGYASRFGEYKEVEDFQGNDMLKGLLCQIDGEAKKENAVIMPAYFTDEDQKKLFEGAKVGDIVTYNPIKAEGKNGLASNLGLKAEEVENMTGDFTFQIEHITRHVDAEINSELFVKVYGESVTTEEDFRARVKAEIEGNMKMDSDYRFEIDAKAAILKKVGNPEFPEAFLKRWLLATNKDLTAEKIEEDFPKMLEALKWDLAKSKLAEEFDVKVEENDVLEIAKEYTRMQFMQYGMGQVDDALLTQYAAQMLKDEKQVRNLYERAAEKKIFAAVKGVVKLDEKTVSQEEFGKLWE